MDTTGARTAESLAARFHDVDSSAVPEDFVAYLRKMEESESGLAVREATYRAVESAGRRGVDVGCGAGRAVADLVRLGKDAVGVDASRSMVDAALARFPHCQVVRGSAFELPFEDAELSWYRSERTFLHFPEPAEALSEARRVLRPGGTIVLADPDLASMVVSSRLPETTGAVKDAFCSAVPNPHAGTHNAYHLADAGFTGISVVPVMATLSDHASAFGVVLEPALTAALARGAVGEEEAARWKDDLGDLSRRGAFTATAVFFVTTARLAP
ncbi:methyltransferase domain-containing protein [Streptomyces sp. S6]